MRRMEARRKKARALQLRFSQSFEQRREQPDAPVPVLDIGSVHDRVHQQAFRVDEYVALLALDLLARIIARRVDRGPPFSALFTLWLSMIAAVGLASRPACSRHFT